MSCFYYGGENESSREEVLFSGIVIKGWQNDSSLVCLFTDYIVLNTFLFIHGFILEDL